MNDPFLTKNGVLINKLGITDEKELQQAEADIGFLKLINVDQVNIRFFDIDIIKQIHYHIFSDIFEWAGKFRNVPLYKEELVIPGISVPYSEPKNIERDLRTKLNELNSISWQNLTPEEIAYKFARKIALIWRVHPFRDGNTRTTLSFAYLYAKEHNFPFDIETFTEGLCRKYDNNGKVTAYSIRDFFVLACLDEKDYPEVKPLASVFAKAINAYKEKNSSEEKRGLKF